MGGAWVGKILVLVINRKTPQGEFHGGVGSIPEQQERKLERVWTANCAETVPNER